MQKHRLSNMQKIYLPLKRGIDIILSLIGCIILSPVLLIICIAIKVDSRGPILFKQKRVGIHKQLFPMLKFRTMYTDTPKASKTPVTSDDGNVALYAGMGVIALAAVVAMIFFKKKNA